MDHIKSIIFIVLLLTPYQLFATDYYLSPTGSDAGDGSMGNPWKSLGYALNRDQNGGTNARVDGAVGGPHTLYLRGGTYYTDGMTNEDTDNGPQIETNTAGVSVETVTVKSSQKPYYSLLQIF